MKLPIVTLVGREKIKVIYADKKWAFERGVNYTDVHPSFSAHLATLKDDKGKFLFHIDHGTKAVKAVKENSIEAVNEEGALKKRLANKKSEKLKAEKARKEDQDLQKEIT